MDIKKTSSINSNVTSKIIVIGDEILLLRKLYIDNYVIK